VATTYNAYFGTQSGNLTLVASGLTSASLAATYLIEAFGNAAYDTTYYWRIDAVNEFGTTQGDEWSFTTIPFDQPRISYILLPGGNGSGPYDDPPGTRGVDWEWTAENYFIPAIHRLVAAANNAIWYEDI